MYRYKAQYSLDCENGIDLLLKLFFLQNHLRCLRLQQQIKTIQEELGGNINELEIKELREKASRKKWPAEVAQVFEKELRKLERLHPQSPDYSVQTQYVQNIVNLPWNEYSKDNFNLSHAQFLLNRLDLLLKEIFFLLLIVILMCLHLDGSFQLHQLILAVQDKK